MFNTKEVELLLQKQHDRFDDSENDFDNRSKVANDKDRGGDSLMSDEKKVQAYQQTEGGGYGRVPQPGLPTYTEAWALIEAARRMAAASDHADTSDIKDRNKVRDALRLNWRLWTIFQAEMTVDNTSNLPDEIRLNMLTLCKFVDKHTVEALKDPLPAKVSTLVEINRNIASGLLASLEKAAQESGAAQGDSVDETTSAAADVPSGHDSEI